MNRKFVIIEADEVSSVDFSQVIESNADTLRHSSDGKTFVKYDGDKPSFLDGKEELGYSEMLETLDSNEWNPPSDL